MTRARIHALSIAGIFGVALAFLPGWAFSQTRPGISAFVKAPEGCSYADPLDANDMFSFTEAQIQALSLANRGEHGTLYLQAADAPAGLTNDKFANLRQERIGDTCAGFILSPYTKSKNQKAAAVAKQLVADYGELQKMTDERFGLVMQLSMQTSYGVPVRTRLSEIKDRREKVLRNMNETLKTSLSLLVDEDQTDFEGKPGRILLTHDQRTDLRDFLLTRFPSLRKEMRGTEEPDDYTRQAAQIRSFLAGPPAPASK